MVDKDKITKEKITDALKGKLGLSTAICGEIVDHFFNEIFAVVQQNQKLVLANFGKFSLNYKKARPGRNLKTRQAVIIPARTVMSFTPSKTLKIIVNHGNIRPLA